MKCSTFIKFWVIWLVAMFMLIVGTLPAGAASQWVKNGDCAHSGMSILLRDASGRRWTLRPGASVNMTSGGRQVWVGSHTYLLKDSCWHGAWQLAYSQGFWKSFSWRGLPIEFGEERY